MIYEKTQQLVCDMKKKIETVIEQGVNPKDLFTLADMMNAYKIMKEFVASCDENDQPIMITGSLETWDSSRIENEISAAQIYYDKWISTQKDYFRQMALDELKHAQIIIEYAENLNDMQIINYKNSIQSLNLRLQ